VAGRNVARTRFLSALGRLVLVVALAVLLGLLGVGGAISALGDTERIGVHTAGRLMYEHDESGSLGDFSIHRYRDSYLEGMLGWPPVTASFLAQSSLLPDELAIYYGFPSLVNGSAGDLDAAAAVFGEYDIVVFGDSLQFPQYTGEPGQIPYYGCDQNSHFDHDNTVEIIARLKTPPNETVAYGYVSIGGENTAWLCPPEDPVPAPLTMAEIKSRVDSWADMGVTGIFLDEAEYGFGCSRERQNEVVDYVHGKGLSVFINAWDPDDVFKAEVVNEVLYTTGYLAGTYSTIQMNPEAAPTHLGADDIYLHESFQIIVSQFQDPADWVTKSDKALSFKNQFDTRMATVTTVSANDPGFDQSKFDYAWWSTLLYGFDAMGWGELFFSASDNSLPSRTRPDPGEIGSGFTLPVIHDPPVHTRTTTAGTIEVNTDTHTGTFTASDTDNDGCADSEELGADPVLGGTRDPLDPYDFYDVPVPTAFNGGTLADRDKAVSIINDVLAVLEYTGTSDGGPPNSIGRQYNQDNNSDGEDDGLLYDRWVGATWSDAPDGAVTVIVDVLLVLAQSGHSCQAPP